MPQKKGAKKKKKQAVAQPGSPSSGLFCLRGAVPQFWEVAGEYPDGQALEDGEFSIALVVEGVEVLVYGSREIWRKQVGGLPSERGTCPLETFFAWFEKGAATGADNAHVALVGSGKGERALIYSVIEAHFPGLEAVSQGVGEDREVAVYIRGKAPKPTADENIRAQGIRLYKFAREAGLTQHSQDEIVERLATGTLTDELKGLWEKRAAEQEVVERLLLAVAQDDANCVKEICRKCPGVTNVAHVDNSELPLLVAARLNCENAARALVEMGVSLEAKCPSTNRTALKVARTFESTAVEGVLLQMGAHDPEAASFPIPNEQLTSLGCSQASRTQGSEEEANCTQPTCTLAKTSNTTSSNPPHCILGQSQLREQAQGECSSNNSHKGGSNGGIGGGSNTEGKGVPASLFGGSHGLSSYSSTTWAAAAAAAGLGLVLLASLSRIRK